jgi:hypothetical protein
MEYMVGLQDLINTEFLSWYEFSMLSDFDSSNFYRMEQSTVYSSWMMFVHTEIFNDDVCAVLQF